jgi:hypothetical protein
MPHLDTPPQVAESVGALLLRFEDEASLYAWQGRLSRAIYGASVKSLSFQFHHLFGVQKEIV